MATAGTPEVWLRGPLPGFEPALMPVAHALLQAREDVERVASDTTPEELWQRPGGAASIGFHARHAAGALDRLLTYARGEALTDEQRAFAKREGEPGDPPATLAAVAAEVRLLIEKAFEQLRTTPALSLLDARKIGRAELPTNVIGLLFHAAEHATRHAGQAITTAKILRGSQPPS